jgi:hypothetical protein
VALVPRRIGRYSRSMADPADMDALAKRYIELWQEQLAKVSADPSVTEAWRFVFESAAKNMGWTPDAIAAYTAAAQASSTPGAATAASPFGHGGSDPTDVLRRLDALEQRLSSLEADQDGD